MGKKKALTVLFTILAVSISLAMPVSAQQAPASSSVVYLNGIIQPFWIIANSADLDFNVGGGTAKATIRYSKPAAASASMSVIIYSKAPGSSSWTKAASSSSASASCSAKAGYQYKAEATLTLTMNGTKEIIDLSDGPYTA